MPSLRNIAIRYQVLLESVKTAEAIRFSAVVKKIDSLLREWVLTLNAGKLSDISAREFKAALNDLQKALTSAVDKQGAELLRQAARSAEAGASFEFRTFQKVAEANKGLTVAAAGASLAKKVLARPLAANGQTVAAFVDSFILSQPQSVIDYAQRAYTNGLTVQQMVQGIRGTKARGFKDGLLATTQRKAEAVARTTIQHAASAGRQEVWQRNSDAVKGYIFIATLDAVTSDVCRALDQRRFKLGEGPVPPLHINCRSTTIAELDDSLKFLREGATRSAKFGPVDAELSYYDWLKLQDPKFQDTVLGETRGQVFRDGGLSANRFAELSLNKNFEPRTLDEMRALEPLAFARALER